MAFSVTNLGTVGNTTGATGVITLGTSVAAGSLIVVAATETAAIIGTLADTATNTYVSATSTTYFAGGNIVAIFYVKNCLALVSTNTITYTKHTSGKQIGVSACYVTGADTTAPLDTAVSASATGTSTTPSVTGGTAGASGELNFGAVATNTPATFTQASGWATPFNEPTAQAGIQEDGGNQVNSGTSGLTFNPTYSSSGAWGALIVGFKAAATAISLGTSRLLMGMGT